MTKYICIHGHFYQPPRENPWLDAIETQDSAAPYHDWNERITAECYAPNAAARILDGEDRIVAILNNYARISFNMGPTLLSWMERFSPETYAAILEADRESMRRFSGHGSAMAQAFHHAIVPLSNRRDKQTEIRWGVADFRHRYGRSPEGMWLPEAAVDLETLDLMAAEGITFTVLSPYQAGQVRPIGEPEWEDATAGKVDTTCAYLQKLPSGRSIAIFFYDAPISQAVAFEWLLNRGEDLADRLLGAYTENGAAQLINIATDGETYGHHHSYGEMALAYALHYIETHELAQVINYGEYLALYPPQDEVQIVENSSWSCFHGVERWRSDCGCNTGGREGWNQAWRGPLRDALDWLRDEIGPRYEQKARSIFRDPWAARDDYIHVMLDRSSERIEAFLARHLRPRANPDRVMVLRLMELQRHALMMYTSCGWFFSELSGIETTQVMQYAARAIQLARELIGVDLQPQFIEQLRRASSNIPEERDGASIYERRVRPLVVDLVNVAAHYALASLFDGFGERHELYCYRIERGRRHLLDSGATRLGIGTLALTSMITGESTQISYGALHLGAQTMLGGVRPGDGGQALDYLAREASVAFQRADIAEIIRLLSGYFGQLDYSLRSLFRDQQREVLSTILRSTLAEVEEAYHALYTQHAALMRFIADLHMPPPAEFNLAAAFTLNAALRRAVSADPLRPEVIRQLLEEARQAGVSLDIAGAAYTLLETLRRLGRELLAQPDSVPTLTQLILAVEAAHALPHSVDLRSSQQRYHALVHMPPPGQPDLERAVQFKRLGELLGFRVE